jgi:hypothetical protein
MSLLFEEIDSQSSSIGQISLRRRRMPAFGDRDIYEVKLGDEFLMSSMFVDAEEALSTLGLAAVQTNDNNKDGLSVVVGGLGLGYTPYSNTTLSPSLLLSLVCTAAKPNVDNASSASTNILDIKNSSPNFTS